MADTTNENVRYKLCKIERVLQNMCKTLDSRWVIRSTQIGELRYQLRLHASEIMEIILEWSERESLKQ
mgnify:CR=1 FL=1